ncbi:hypothetical protein NA57DRAFT_60825 [Rhizodiscina lignyota]|uniref:Uncharacterized protein n=1 Tax=Rhizodiscina lignyota TaxID=1504668 RepID=A0A9P4I355_9PEZI|nr:hypothetical protein NA57DRAFT_60825 [Rhizodiscina lignyota]
MLLSKLPAELRGQVYDYCSPGTDLLVLTDHSRKGEETLVVELQNIISLAHIDRQTRVDVLSYLFHNRTIFIKPRDLRWFLTFFDRTVIHHLKHINIVELSSGLWAEPREALNGVSALASLSRDGGTFRRLTLSQNPWRAWHFPPDVEFEGDSNLEALKLLDLPFIRAILDIPNLKYFELKSGDPLGLRASVVEDPAVSDLRITLQQVMRELLNAEQSDDAYRRLDGRTSRTAKSATAWYWMMNRREGEGN